MKMLRDKSGKVDMIDMSIEVLIFASIIGIVAGFVTDAVANTSGAVSLLIGLVTIFVVIAFIRGITKKAKGGK